MDALAPPSSPAMRTSAQGLALRIAQHAVLLDDQRAAQGDHHQNAQQAAAQGDQADGDHGGSVAQALLGPHEQGGQGEDGARGHRLTGGADGLNHVVFQDGVSPQNLADDTHGNHCRGNGRRHRHANTQSQIRVCSAEDDGQQSAQQDGYCCELRHDLVGRNIRLEFLVFHDFRSLLCLIFLSPRHIPAQPLSWTAAAVLSSEAGRLASPQGHSLFIV